MISFKNKHMQHFFEEIKEMEYVDIDLMIAEKKVQLDHAKNTNNLFIACYVSFLVLGVAKSLFGNIFENLYYFIGYFSLSFAGIYIGTYCYRRIVKVPLCEYEVLNYLKETNFSTKPTTDTLENENQQSAM
ncbi:hypothetical protein [Enterococcus raffinosus]|uniref:hypothetical protein n=1 Tax=Enterococcus raffinosus TaxID=71452 RepID=UPI003AC3003E